MKNKYAILDDIGVMKVSDTVVLFSPEDKDLLGVHKWRETDGCIVSTIDSKKVRMHRYILKAEGSVIVDHINGNHFDNRRANLRFVTPSENQMNRLSRRGRLKNIYKLGTNKYEVKISKDGVIRCRKKFSNLDTAIMFRDRALEDVHGTFTRKG